VALRASEVLQERQAAREVAALAEPGVSAAGGPEVPAERQERAAPARTAAVLVAAAIRAPCRRRTATAIQSAS